MLPYIRKSSSVTIFPVGKAPITVTSDHVNFQAVVDAIVANDFVAAVELASVNTFFKNVTKGKVSVSDDGVTYNGAPITGYLANKMITFFNEGLPVDHYCLFLENLMANPSMVSRNELFLFLEAANLPITEDGCFLAYKAVRSDFRDMHSGKFDNSPGQILEMDRAQVDDDRERTCSYGFHAAAYDYARDFMGGGGTLVAVKINPKDVVSVPSDYNNQKLRTCRYEVMFEVEGARNIFEGVHHYDTGTSILDADADSDDDGVDYDNAADAYDAGWSEGYDEGYKDGYNMVADSPRI